MPLTSFRVPTRIMLFDRSSGLERTLTCSYTD